MAEGYLLAVLTVAAMKAIGLVCIKIGDGANLQPALLCLGIYLEVVADGGCETHVAATKAQYAVRQLQLDEKPLDMVEHLLVALA